MIPPNGTYVLHELLADGTNFLAQGGTKHHGLLIMRSSTEDLLDVTAHIQRFQHLVTLIENEMLRLLQLQVLILDQGQNTSGGADHNVGAVILERFMVLLDAGSTVED